MAHRVKILFKEFVTHDVIRFILEKPEGFDFIPGYHTEIAIDKEDMRDDAHPFTFTSLPSDDILEFTIKIYPEHHGMTEKLADLSPGGSLILDGSKGSIEYKGPGVFIAGGAGITPFIAILRDLQRQGKLAGNTLLFSNKRHEDIILEREFKHMLKDRCIFTLTDEQRTGYLHEFIDKAFLQKHIKDFSSNFYLCGPPGMVRDISAMLEELGAEPDTLVFD